MPYDFPTIHVSDRKFLKVHTFWGSATSDPGYRPTLGLKQVEPPYLYGYAVRIRLPWLRFGLDDHKKSLGGTAYFFGICRERKERKPLIHPLDD